MLIKYIEHTYLLNKLILLLYCMCGNNVFYSISLDSRFFKIVALVKSRV